MMNVARTKLFLLLCLLSQAFTAAVFAEEDETLFRFSGSVLNQTGYIGLRGDIPDAAASDWYSLTSARVSFGKNSGQGRFRAELWTSYDSVMGRWDLSLDEAWGEWRPGPFLAARLGRSRLQFGPCIAFNPANSFVTRNIFDSRSNKAGQDGLSLEILPLLVAGEQDLPVSLVMNASFILPGDSLEQGASAGPYDIEESSALGRITAYLPGTGVLGPTELGLSGDLRRLGVTGVRGYPPFAAGAWLSADIAGFVFGTEGAIRSSGYRSASVAGAAVTAQADGNPEYEFAFSLNRKIGNFWAILESDYNSSKDKWLGFAQLSRTIEDMNLSASGLMDFDTLAARTAIEAAWDLTDFLVLRMQLSWNYLPEKWDEDLPSVYAAGLALECFF